MWYTVHKKDQKIAVLPSVGDPWHFLVFKTLHADPDSLEMLDPDPYPYSINPNPQDWVFPNLYVATFFVLPTRWASFLVVRMWSMKMQ